MKVVVTYVIPEDAPSWFHNCVRDGDHSGILEYVEGREIYNKVEVIHD